jgi:DNA-binding CsgD family transcriptional regulator
MAVPHTKGSLKLISDSFSAAAFDSSLWSSAMDATAVATGSTGSVLLPVQGHLPTVPVSQSVTELLDTYLQQGWHERDERYRGIPIMRQRGVTCDLDFVHPDEVARSSYYQEFLAPLGLRWFVGVRVAAGDDLWCLAIQRSAAQGLPSRQELNALGALSSSLSSAAAVANALRFSRAQGALRAFEISGSAVVMIDRHGQTLLLNQAAERIIHSGDLKISGNRIVCQDRAATASLDRALHALIWRREDPSLLPPVVLPRREGRPILAYLSRLPTHAMDAFDPCQAVVVLVDLEARIGLVERDLVQIFKLTSAEARLAARLRSGETIEQAASDLGISYETSRNHLKAIFRKTGISRQSRLVALLAQLRTR